MLHGETRRTMPLTLEPIVWTAADVTGIEAIDDDHRKLVLLFNEVLAACSAGVGSGIIERAMDAAIALTRAHFTREEQYLEAAGYPGLEAHRQEHRALQKQLLSIAGQLTGGAPMSVDPGVAGFLREWAIRHILGHDRDLVAYLQGGET
jgi:hemerythrin